MVDSLPPLLFTFSFHSEENDKPEKQRQIYSFGSIRSYDLETALQESLVTPPLSFAVCSELHS